jgi:hypothetical protein
MPKFVIIDLNFLYLLSVDSVAILTNEFELFWALRSSESGSVCEEYTSVVGESV